MANLKDSYWVVQSNKLGNILEKTTTVNQQKFFAIYIAKLNPFNPDTRKVTFSLDEYAKVMDLKRFNITKLKEESGKLVAMPVTIDREDGGFFTVPTFCLVELYQKDCKWFVDVECSERLLPYLFKMRKDFYRYKLKNILRLNEKNHQQLYRLLKMLETTGERVVKLEKLKLCLGLENSKYDYKEFNRRVLMGCQKAINENTDIIFEFKPLRKGRRVDSIQFDIKKNPEYKDQLHIDDYDYYLEQQQDIKADNEELEEWGIVSDELENSFENRLKFFSEALNHEFSPEQVEVLFKMAVPFIERKKHKYSFDTSMYDYLALKFAELNAKKNIKLRYNYLVKLIKIDIADIE